MMTTDTSDFDPQMGSGGLRTKSSFNLYLLYFSKVWPVPLLPPLASHNVDGKASLRNFVHPSHDSATRSERVCPVHSLIIAGKCRKISFLLLMSCTAHAFRHTSSWQPLSQLSYWSYAALNEALTIDFSCLRGNVDQGHKCVSDWLIFKSNKAALKRKSNNVDKHYCGAISWWKMTMNSRHGILVGTRLQA
jgi:hypothetical protein